MKRLGLIAAAVAALAVGGCTGNMPYDPNLLGVTGTTFSIAPVPAQTVAPGGVAAFPITVTELLKTAPSRNHAPVTLSVTGVPEGMAASFTVNPVNPTFSGAQTQLLIDTDPGDGGSSPRGIRSIAPSTFDLTITGTDGTDTRSVTTTLTVTLLTTFTLDPVNDQNVSFGQIAEFPINVREIVASLSSRATEPVTLTVEGVPEFMAASFTVNPVDPTPTGAATTLLVDTNPDTGDRPKRQIKSRGTGGDEFLLTIRASNGIREETRTATLFLSSGGG